MPLSLQLVMEQITIIEFLLPVSLFSSSSPLFFLSVSSSIHVSLSVLTTLSIGEKLEENLAIDNDRKKMKKTKKIGPL